MCPLLLLEITLPHWTLNVACNKHVKWFKYINFSDFFHIRRLKKVHEVNNFKHDVPFWKPYTFSKWFRNRSLRCSISTGELTLSLLALELETPALCSWCKWRQAGTSSFILTIIGALTFFYTISKCLMHTLCKQKVLSCVSVTNNCLMLRLRMFETFISPVWYAGWNS
jgi:hypothetical protein